MFNKGDFKMENILKFSVITGSIGQVGDRFLSSGYKEETNLEGKLRELKTISDLQGVELCYNITGDESDAAQIKELLNTYNFVVPAVSTPLFSAKTWKYGSLSTSDQKVRKEAVEVAKKTIDFAEGVGAPLVNFWLGQDGFDYCFQVDYAKQWEYLIEGVRECADYKPHIRLTLEPKPREPRNRSLIDSAFTALLLVQDIQRENVGLTIDIGHVLQDKRNMAQAVEIAARYGKLFHLHVNDNYADWDDDMIVGSVHLIEYVEFFFVLRKINYEGWVSVDIFPFRENAFRATEECIEYMKVMDKMVDTLGYNELNNFIQKETDATDVLKHIREKLFS